MAYRKRSRGAVGMGVYMAHRANLIPSPLYFLFQFLRAIFMLGR